jgi:histidyl-tRNA synthetase
MLIFGIIFNVGPIAESVKPWHSVWMKFQSVKGMNDIGDKEMHLWRYVEQKVRKLYEDSGFTAVITPELEFTELFSRGVGDTSDIVQKEMYTFTDKNGDSLTLRPEGTASVVRAVIQHNWMYENSTLKMYYFMPMFRHERPQKGRYRIHYQFGLEIFGVSGPESDVEVISVQALLFKKLGLNDISLQINSIGDNNCRPAYRELLLKELTKVKDKLCADCHKRMEKNPLRVFDCKIETCRAAVKNMPTQLDHLCEPCQKHFAGVKSGLDELGIKYNVNPHIVRGIDYYCRTCFEFTTDRIGAQGTVCGGGRYDYLFEEFGAKATPGFGVGMGFERLLMLLENKQGEAIRCPDLAIVIADESGKSFCHQLTYKLRENDLYVDLDLEGRSVKSQFKRANKIGAKYVLTIGSREVSEKKGKIKNMADSKETEISLGLGESDLQKIMEEVRS